MSAQFKMTGVRLSYLAATGVFLVLIAVLIVFLQPFNEATRQISQANYLLTEVGAKLDAVVVTARNDRNTTQPQIVERVQRTLSTAGSSIDNLRKQMETVFEAFLVSEGKMSTIEEWLVDEKHFDVGALRKRMQFLLAGIDAMLEETDFLSKVKAKDFDWAVDNLLIVHERQTSPAINAMLAAFAGQASDISTSLSRLTHQFALGICLVMVLCVAFIFIPMERMITQSIRLMRFETDRAEQASRAAESADRA
ncbi:MAG: hypothetical protein KDJ90_23730, partial [Nitratireductor sp.]|nr:hypothetical protein [Nitratireductor sp.]